MEAPAPTHAATRRCPRCGRRVAAPSCPEHGALELEALGVPPERPPAEIPGYVIRQCLAEGGFGTIYQAERIADGLVVAIKLERHDGPAQGGALLTEVAALRAVAPPHVPSVHATGSLPDGSAYVVMELLELPTLAARILAQATQGMPIPELTACARALCAAVAAVHRQGLVHCDLKPENIFIGGDPPVARLVDFGIARAANAPGSGNAVVAGTAEYMAPEQCLGAALDPRTDVYAVGIILYEMLTGRPPFFGLPGEVKQAQVERRPVRPSSLVPVPALMEEVILRCLAKEPEARFGDSAAVGAALAAAAGAPGPVVAVATATPKPASPEGGRDQRPVGLVFFETGRGTDAVLSLLKAFAGQLALARGHLYVALFGDEASENPVRRAFRAAERLVGSEMTPRALVHLAPVVVQTRPDGARRYMSPLLGGRPEQFPRPSDPPGVLFTQAARALVPEVPASLVAERELWVAAPAVEAPIQATVIRDLHPLIGREDLVQALVASAARALGGIGHPAATIATVIGEAGLGKSHLFADLLGRLRSESGATQLIELRAREPVGGEADQVLRELLHRVVGLPHDPPADNGQGLLETRLGAALGREVAVGVGLVLGWRSPDAPEVRAQAVAPGVLRTAAARAVGAALRRLAAERPVLLVLDDAHFAGQATLDALEDATRPESEDDHLPLWVCVLARPSFRDNRPEWGERAAAREVFRLEALDAGNAADLCRRLLLPAEQVPLPVVERLVSRTQGIPFLLVELVRGLKNQGLVRQNEKGGGYHVATDEVERLPDLPLVDWLARREVDGLAPELRAHARLIALLGECTAGEVAGVVGELERSVGAEGFPLDAAVAIRKLVWIELLVTHRTGRVGFRHALIRDAVAKATPEAECRRIHHAALVFYRDRARLSEAERLPRIAFHAKRGGHAAEAAAAYLRLAEDARDRHSYLDAELLYSETMDQLAEDAPGMRSLSLKGRGLMRYRLGRYDDALKDFAQAGKLARRLGDVMTECDVLLDAATALDWMDEYRRSQELVEKVRALAANAATPLVEARLLMGLARSSFRFNRDEEATGLFAQAAACAERLGDAGYETLVISLLLGGYILATLGRIEPSAAAFERVIALCEERGDKLHLGAAVGNRMALWMALGDKDRLLADLNRLLDIARELGNGRMEQQAHYYLGMFQMWLGDAAEAERHARRAVEIDDRRFGEAARPESLVLLARVLATSGQVVLAREILTTIQGRLAGARSRGDREIDLLPSEDVFLAMVDLYTRDTGDAEWRALADRAHEVLTAQDRVELLAMAGRAAARRNDVPAAREAFAAALAITTTAPHVMRSQLEAALGSLGD